MSDARGLKLRREWREKFMRSLASLEPNPRDHHICGGCKNPFDEHPGDYADCVKDILASDGRLAD